MNSRVKFAWVIALPFSASALFGQAALRLEPGDEIATAVERAVARQKPGESVEVVLSDGVYEMTRGLELAATNVTIRAEHPGKVTIVGGRAFRGRDFTRKAAENWKVAGRLAGEARKHVVALRVPMTLRAFFEAGCHTGGALWCYPDFNRYNLGQNLPTYPCLTIGGRRMELARWPNADYFWPGTNDTVRMPNAKEKSVLVRARGSRMSEWRCKTDNIAAAGWINGCTYLDCCCPVTDYVKASNAVEVASENFNTDSSRLYFFNILEELDAPGEWCYNRETGTLVLYPPERFSDDSLCAVGFVREPLFHVTGSRVSILGIDFTAKIGHPTVVIEQGTDNLVRGCTFGGIGYNGIVMMGRRNAVRDCDFRDIVCSAVHVVGGVEKTMERGENRVDNCRVTNYAILCTSWAMGGIYLDGVGNTVSHCEVSDGPETGLYLAGIGNTIEYCRVWDVVKQFDDVGLVYVPGGTRCYGNVLRYNDLSGRPGEVVGIYFDDTSSGSTAYGNIVRDCARGALVGGGRDNVISNNVFVSCFTGVQIDNRGLDWSSFTSTPDAKHRENLRKRLDLTNSTARIAATYPKLVTWLDDMVPLRSYADNVFANNLILNPYGFDSDAKFAKDRTIPADRLVYANNLCVRTRGATGPYDPIRHPELLPTNEYSKIAYLISKPIGPTRLVDGTAEEPVDLGFIDVPESRFDPWPYYTRYVQQAWINMPKLFEFRRAGMDKPIGMKPYRVGNFNLKPNAKLKELMPQFQPIPWDKIGSSRCRRMADVLHTANGIHTNDCRAFGRIEKGVLLLTFDDAHYDQWVEIIPLFKKYDAHVSFFPNGELDDHALFQLKKLKDAGHTVGIHTVHHADAREAWESGRGAEYVEREVKPQLAAYAKIGHVARAMAYPCNCRNEAADAMLMEQCGIRRFRSGHVVRYDPGHQYPKPDLVRTDEVFSLWRIWRTSRSSKVSASARTIVRTLPKLSPVSIGRPIAMRC